MNTEIKAASSALVRARQRPVITEMKHTLYQIAPQVLLVNLRNL
jgi:hypothetical protein